jgi:hypothetical protein
MFYNHVFYTYIYILFLYFFYSYVFTILWSKEALSEVKLSGGETEVERVSLSESGIQTALASLTERIIQTRKKGIICTDAEPNAFIPKLYQTPS